MVANAKRWLLVVALIALAMIAWLYLTRPKQSTPKQLMVPAFNQGAVTSIVAKVEQAHPARPTTVTESNPSDEPTNELPDVLAATNIEQWRSLIKNLQPDSSLPNFWITKHRQKGVDSVLLKSKGKSIVYKTDSVDVSVANSAGDVLEAEIYTPKMDIVETRELGLRICKMFGFDSAGFAAWCKSVGNNWLDAPLFYVGDDNHSLHIRTSYNYQQPWIMILIIQPEKAHSEFMREVQRQAQKQAH
jgi:hypothetical protein